jgi:hypothetical protein
LIETNLDLAFRKGVGIPEHVLGTEVFVLHTQVMNLAGWLEVLECSILIVFFYLSDAFYLSCSLSLCSSTSLLVVMVLNGERPAVTVAD